MTDTVEVDVVVGGGGVAGTAAAVALQQLGYHVVLIEPGQHDERRLAGELFHPPGVAGLAELGLLPALTCGSIASINGFSVFSGSECIRLPYDCVPVHGKAGFCLEHGLIRQRMMKAASALSNITVKQDARVVGVDQGETSRVFVDVANRNTNSRYCCRMLIAADGAPSRLARLAGIGVHDRRISTVIGYRIGIQNLPEPKYGSVYLGAETPILVYPLGLGQARVLFDIPYRSGQHATSSDCLALTAAMPAALREEVVHAIATQPRISMATRAITPESPVRNHVVLVGDAGGSCHPLTATGMTMCISDALLLRDALTAERGDFTKALRLYTQRRRWPQATRLVLADALRDAFIGASPEMRVVRRGIISYWQGNGPGRVATLALLSTADGRPLALLRQILEVMVRGFAAHLRDPLPADRDIRCVRVVHALFANLFGHLRKIVFGSRSFAHERAHPKLPVSRKGQSTPLAAGDDAVGIPTHPAVSGEPRQVHKTEQ
jgi:squalene monooxygenase